VIKIAIIHLNSSFFCDLNHKSEVSNFWGDRKETHL